MTVERSQLLAGRATSGASAAASGRLAEASGGAGTSDSVAPDGESRNRLASVAEMRPSVAMPVNIRKTPAILPFWVSGTMSP